MFVISLQLQYSDLVNFLVLVGEMSSPVLLFEDFNLSEGGKEIEFLIKLFNLGPNYNPAEQNTLTGNCIDFL